MPSASLKPETSTSSLPINSSSTPPACHGSWTNCPDLRKTGTKEAFVNFLNTITLAVKKCTHSPISCSWTVKYSTSCVFRHNAWHKPDLVLLDGRPTPKDTLISGNWRVAMAVAELKSSSKNTSWKEIGEQLAGEYLMLNQKLDELTLTLRQSYYYLGDTRWPQCSGHCQFCE